MIRLDLLLLRLTLTNTDEEEILEGDSSFLSGLFCLYTSWHNKIAYL